MFKIDNIIATQIASGNIIHQIYLIATHAIYLCMLILFEIMYYKKAQGSPKFKKFNIFCVSVISFVQIMATTLFTINIPNISHLEVSDGFTSITLQLMFFGIVWSIFNCISAMLFKNEKKEKQHAIIQYAVIILILAIWYIGFGIGFEYIPIVL